jgi:hypothetical protein
MLRDDKTSTNQRNDSDGKRGRAHFGHAWCDRLQVSAQVFGKWQHQDGCESEARGGEPIVARVITWRKQAGDHATPIVIVWKHPLRLRVPKKDKKMRASNRTNVDLRQNIGDKRIALRNEPRNLLKSGGDSDLQSVMIE